MTVNPGNPTLNGSTFVTAMLKGRAGHFALKGGDAQSGQLQVLYDGPRPEGYEVMQKQVIGLPVQPYCPDHVRHRE